MKFDNLFLLNEPGQLFFAICILGLIWFVYKYFSFTTKIEFFKDLTKSKWSRDIDYSQFENNDGYPFEYLNGWQPVLQSRDIAANQIKGVNAFGRDLVVFRSGTGKISVLDAYCPHFGAYLPLGGSVIGNSIRCPFHGWTFNGDGDCIHVPGLESNNFPKAKVNSYESVEINGQILVWFHQDNESPSWQPMIFEKLDGLEYFGKCQIISGGNSVDLLANLGDSVHAEVIHTSFITVDPMSVFTQNLWFKIWSQIVFIDIKLTFDATDPLSPNGTHRSLVNVYLFGFKVETTELIIEMDGPNLGYVYFKGGILEKMRVCVIVTTRQLPNHKFIFYTEQHCLPTFWARLVARIFMEFEKCQIERDLIIFMNKKFVSRPYLAANETELVKMYRWKKQFYSNK